MVTAVCYREMSVCTALNTSRLVLNLWDMF